MNNDETNKRLMAAKQYFDEYIGLGSACNPMPATYQKNVSQSLLAIASALADIRDELRIMNGRSDKDGNT